jgi:hypothetical protein
MLTYYQLIINYFDTEGLVKLPLCYPSDIATINLTVSNVPPCLILCRHVTVDCLWLSVAIVLVLCSSIVSIQPTFPSLSLHTFFFYNFSTIALVLCRLRHLSLFFSVVSRWCILGSEVGNYMGIHAN